MSPQQYIEQQNAIREPISGSGIRTISTVAQGAGRPVNMLVETGDPTTLVETGPEIYNVLYVREGDHYFVDGAGDVTVQIGGDPNNTLIYRGFSYLVDDSGSRFILDDDAAEIARLYQVAFGREPDEAGLEFWLNAFKNGVATIDHIAKEFLSSPEFIERYGDIRTFTPETFITQLYNNILDREPEPAGFDFWVTAVRNGEDPEHIVEEFARSDENNIKSREWAVNLSDGGFIGEDFFIAREDFSAILSDILYSGAFSDLSNLSLSETEIQFKVNDSLTMEKSSGRGQFSEGGEFVIRNTGSPFDGKLEIIVPDELNHVRFSLFDPDVEPIPGLTSLTFDLIATPGEQDSPYLEWVFDNTSAGARIFLDGTQQDIINPSISRIVAAGEEQARPAEIHNFIVGQDVIEHDGILRETDLESEFLDQDYSPASFVLPVLKDTPSDAVSIANALSDAQLTYEEVGGVLVQDGFDLDIWIVFNTFQLAPTAINTIPVRNEADGNNRVDDYELMLNMELKNVEINPGDPLILQDILLPEGDSGRFMNTANLEFDYLFL